MNLALTLAVFVRRLRFLAATVLVLGCGDAMAQITSLSRGLPHYGRYSLSAEVFQRLLAAL